MHNDNSTNEEKNLKTGIACGLASSLLFGFSFIFIKRIIGQVSVFTLLSGRFVFAFTIMLVMIGIGAFKINLKGKQVKQLALIALISPTLYFIFESLGIKLTTASETATMTACIPIMTMVLSTLVIKEPPTKRQAVSIVISVVGVVTVMLAKGMSAAFSPLGYLLLTGAVVTDSLCAVLTRKHTEFSASERSFMMTFFGAVVFTTAAVVEHISAGTLLEFIMLPVANRDFLIAVLYLSGACSVAGSMLGRIAIAHIGANRTASFAGVSTIISVLASIVLLKESVTFLQGVGTLLIIVGVYVTNSRDRNIYNLLQEKIKNTVGRI